MCGTPALSQFCNSFEWFTLCFSFKKWHLQFPPLLPSYHFIWLILFISDPSVYLTACPENGLPSCLICKKTFSLEANARRHIKNIHLAKPVKCDLCDKVFGNTRNCQDHKRLHHNVRRAKNPIPSPDHIEITSWHMEEVDMWIYTSFIKKWYLLI